MLIRDALALINSQEQRIKELTEDVERLRKQCGEIIVECDERDAERLKQVAELTAENERLRKRNAVLIEDNHILSGECIPMAKADTVRKMQERLKSLLKTDYINGTREQALSAIDQIAKEMLEGME
jgi:regulator of replication initiation timing